MTKIVAITNNYNAVEAVNISILHTAQEGYPAIVYISEQWIFMSDTILPTGTLTHNDIENIISCDVEELYDDDGVFELELDNGNIAEVLAL